MGKIRLDKAMVERGLVDSRSLAQRLIMAGKVRVNGQIALKSSIKILPDASVEIKSGPRFVSRGGDKLAAAISAFQINVQGLICADVGASTGGFTDCLLQNKAQRVYAIDVGHGILDWRLRNDPRVIVMERINARYLEQLPESVQLVTIDVSFISLTRILPMIKAWFDPDAKISNTIIPLIKPQFEAGKNEVKRGKGVIKDPIIHLRVLEEILGFAEDEGYSIKGLIQSPISGPKGNKEFLAYLQYPGQKDELVSKLIENVIDTSVE
jgi:23S rRNA (cytidine1920-2'-O)/16S rRNA (cytidine1409-2'-O)-methyltransferase